MPSSEYWKRRSEATLIANEKSILQYEKELKQAYEAAISKLTKEVEAFYARYAKDNNIDLATVRQRLNVTELSNFKKQSQIYLDEVKRLGLDPNYKEYLRDLSAKAYVTKLQELQTNLRHHIETLTTQYAEGLTKELKNIYEDSFYKTLFDVQKQAGFGVSFTALGDKQLQEAVKTKWLGSSFSDRLWTTKNNLLIQLNTLIPQEFVRGRGPHQVAMTLSERLNVNYNNAVRLVRTEMNRISNQATMNSYKTSEVVDRYEYLSTLDNRTSEICRELDGKVFDVKDAQVGVNQPPMHPYCRSTTIPHFDDDEIGSYIDNRIARDKDGNSYLVGKDVTFKEWAEKYASASYVNRITKNPKQYKSMNSTPKQVTQPTPKTLENFAKHTEEWERTKVREKLDEEDIDRVGKVLKEVIDNNDFCMRVSGNALNEILDSGTFKNQMEVGKSRGLYDPITRKTGSQNLFGTDITTKYEDYEKYGYLGTKDKKLDLGDGSTAQYGGIIVTFKKQNLMDRTTFTTADSLGPAMRKDIVAGSVKNPRANGIEKYDLKRVADTIKKGKIPNTKNAQEFVDRLTYGDYFELQYHGKLTLADVQSITMKESTTKGEYATVTPKTLEKIKKAGITLEIIK